MGWKPYMHTRLPSLTHSVLIVLQEVPQGHEMDEPSSCFVYKSAYVYICWMTCNVFVYAYWSVSEHDTPSFDYNENTFLLWNASVNIVLSCFVFGNKFRNSFKSKGFTLKIFKSINENRSFLAEILGMSQSSTISSFGAFWVAFKELFLFRVE